MTKNTTLMGYVNNKAIREFLTKKQGFSTCYQHSLWN